MDNFANVMQWHDWWWLWALFQSHTSPICNCRQLNDSLPIM